MADELTGKQVAILATDGVEEVELTQPREAVERAGATATLISLQSGEVQAMNADINPAGKFQVDKVIDDISAAAYDALLLPGGAVNPDNLRQNTAVIGFVRDMVASNKPIAAICHAPWTLVEADVVRGRRLTSYPSVRTDIRNAGGDVVDEEIVIDGCLITSRDPNDLPVFCRTIVQEFAKDARSATGADASN